MSALGWHNIASDRCVRRAWSACRWNRGFEFQNLEMERAGQCPTEEGLRTPDDHCFTFKSEFQSRTLGRGSQIPTVLGPLPGDNSCLDPTLTCLFVYLFLSFFYLLPFFFPTTIFSRSCVCVTLSSCDRVSLCSLCLCVFMFVFVSVSHCI